MKAHSKGSLHPGFIFELASSITDMCLACIELTKNLFFEDGTVRLCYQTQLVHLVGNGEVRSVLSIVHILGDSYLRERSI